MSAYASPKEFTQIFDTKNFSGAVTTGALTKSQADALYLQYPFAQGTETFQGLTVNGLTNFNGSVNFASPPSTSATTFASNNLITQQGMVKNNNSWTGTNSFTILPSSSATPVNATDLATKAYVDSNSNGGSGTALLTSNNVWKGLNAFNTTLPSSTVTPVNPTDLTTKAYVDGTSTATMRQVTTALNDYVKQLDVTNALLPYLTTSLASTTYLTQTTASSLFSPKKLSNGGNVGNFVTLAFNKTTKDYTSSTSLGSLAIPNAGTWLILGICSISGTGSGGAEFGCSPLQIGQPFAIKNSTLNNMTATTYVNNVQFSIPLISIQTVGSSVSVNCYFFPYLPQNGSGYTMTCSGLLCAIQLS
jgi:hypothetical protein